MQIELENLVALLDLEEIEHNHYRGLSPDEGWQRVYGGQVIGQALVAASRTVDPDRPAHSLHGYFLRPGKVDIPILYIVDRIRDGRSFTTRRVVAIQNGDAIFNMSISFHIREEGLTHQQAMPEVPRPDDLPSEAELRAEQAQQLPEEFREMFTRKRPIEMRPVDPQDMFKPRKRPPHQLCWIRTSDRLPDDPQLHQCALAYLSDWSLLDTAFFPHGISFTNEKLQSASLDHAMWFHLPPKADEWMLYVQESPTSGGARGFTRGTFFTQEGQLIASAAQEGLMRLHD